MPRVIGWRAWYTGGKTFSSVDDTWEGMPNDGVLGVVLYEKGHNPSKNEIYRLILVGEDWYFRAMSENNKYIYGGCKGSSALEIYQRYGGATNGTCVKRGKWTDNETFEALQAEMHAAKNAP